MKIDKPGEIRQLTFDLCVPHGGKYSDDMKPADAQFYEQRLLLRKPQEEFEAQNIAEFVQNSGYQGVDYGGTLSGVKYAGKPPGNRRAYAGQNFQIGFSRLSRRAYLKLPSAGTVTIIDLAGRRIAQIDISNDAYSNCRGKVYTSLSAETRAGLYVAKFRGKGIIAEKVILVP